MDAGPHPALYCHDRYSLAPGILVIWRLAVSYFNNLYPPLKRFIQIQKETPVAEFAEGIVKRQVGAGNFVKQHP